MTFQPIQHGSLQAQAMHKWPRVADAAYRRQATREEVRSSSVEWVSIKQWNQWASVADERCAFA
jgi:hypothetical protein